MLKVAIVGKPNVGKSTLFNRITKTKISITGDQPNITRDRIEKETEWLTQKFIIFDTGGIVNSKNSIQKQINAQVNYAINESKVIIFVVSAKDGITKDDYYISKLLHKQKNVIVILAINKIESEKQKPDWNEYYNLGFGKPILISSEHGIGIGDLLDEVIKNIGKMNKNEESIEKNLPFCIIGKPNVGKSTTVNSILNYERVLVSETPGTTRDAIDIKFKHNHKNYTIIDTAGIRKKGKIEQGVEKFSVIRSKLAIKRSKIVCLMLDGSNPFTEQDEIIGGLAFSANIPVIIIVNKWDLIKDKSEKNQNSIQNKIKQQFKYLNYAPIIFISAKQKTHLKKLFDTIDQIEKKLLIKLPTNALNEVISKAQMNNQPPFFKGGRIHINFINQIEAQVPTFVLFCNNPEYLHFSYSRYLENTLRMSFQLKYVPVVLYFKSKNARIRTKE